MLCVFVPETHRLVGVRGGEGLRDDLGDVVGPPGRGGINVGEGPGHRVVGEAGVVPDRDSVGVVAPAALNKNN